MRACLKLYLDKTYTFEYNVGGNIVSKNEYVYTTGTLGTPTKTYAYAYSNGWKDQLTSFDGQSIVYDASGNPTSYLGNTLTWSRGRLLTQYTNASKTVTMQYDANGIRRSKTAPAGLGLTKTTNYIYDSQGRLRTEITGTNVRQYLYSSDGVMGYEENGQLFLYRKNLFGDITAIYKGTTKMAEYVYDAWGNCTITLDKKSCGTNNPFRYRGYYYDNDLGMYYLMTRYYDPKTGRFINADSLEYLEPNKINGLNLYAYCRNNPVMYVDPIGLNPTYGIILSFAVIIVSAIIGGICGALRSDKTPSNVYIKIPGEEQHNENNNENEELTTADRINNFIKGALLGAYVGTAVDMVLGITFSLMQAPSVGIPMFFVGNAFVLIIRELSKLFQMDLNAPSFDPSKKPQVNLPVNK